MSDELTGSGTTPPYGILNIVLNMGVAPREKRNDSEKIRMKWRPEEATDMKFYNSTKWRKYSTRKRQREPWCSLHMLYVLVNDLGLGEIVPWFSKLDNDIQLRFLRRRGYTGEIMDVDCTDHIIPIKGPFYGSRWNPRNHQTCSHKYHNMKRRMERDGICEEYIETEGGRIPLRMQPGRKRESDPRGV